MLVANKQAVKEVDESFVKCLKTKKARQMPNLFSIVISNDHVFIPKD